MGQRVADVLERALESPPILDKTIGRSFAVRCEGREYEVFMELKLRRKHG